jgi:hypothetical protein
MASYSTITAALALGVDRKRLENLLLRCRIPGTSRGRQGRARRLSRASLLALAAVVRLQEELGIPASQAAELVASGLLSTDALGSDPDRVIPGRRIEPGDGGTTAAATLRRGPFTLSVDVAHLDRELTAALAEAIEVSPRPRRGRPAGTSRGRNG